MMIQQQREMSTFFMAQDCVLALLDLYILGTDIQPLEELGTINDISELCHKLIAKPEVQSILFKNIFTQS
jgi:hypothetical protein